MVKSYKKGVRLEREVIDIFKRAGFGACRSAGSHSPFDVILWKECGDSKKICFVSFVQCKHVNSGRDTEKLINSLEDEYAEDPEGNPLLS